MPPRRVSLAFLSILFLAALGLSAPSSRAEESVLANDQCVGKKLDSAASHCEKVLRAWARWDLHRHRQVRKGQIRRSAAWLHRSWTRANEFAAQDGARCRATTGNSGAVSKVIRSGAKQIAKTINAGLDLTQNPRKTCASRYIKAAAEACEDLIEAEADHLLDRFDDRLREELAEDREDALSDFAKAWAKIDKKKCQTEADPDEVEGLLEDLVSEVVRTASVSPRVSSEWEMIVPDDEVSYRGKSLEPTCWDGKPWVFFARRGTVNKLIVNYQGGGACWNGVTCLGVPGVVNPTFKQSTGPSDNPAGWSSGFADYSNLDNPFRDWNAIFVPYCTGDVHWGDSEFEHVLPDNLGGTRGTVRHKGFVNAQVAEKWAREHFVHPEQVFVTGSSAGAYGAIMNSLYLQEFAYPSARFAVLGDAGNGVITDDFLENDISKWGLEKNLPEWMPGLNVPLTELNASDMYVEAALTYPQNRFATYTAAYDGGSGGQVGFYHVMKSGDNVIEWQRWWRSSCEWNGIMREQNYSAAADADNFRYYIATGSAHTMFGRDRVYTDTTGNVPTVVDWIGDMLAGSDDDWQSAECDDCSTLLPGDPGPPSPVPPYTDDGRLVCEE